MMDLDAIKRRRRRWHHERENNPPSLKPIKGEWDDDVDTLLAEVERLQYAYESKAPGTQGAMLDAFYALLPEGTDTSSKPAPVLLREYIERLQRIEQAARAVITATVADEHKGELWFYSDTTAGAIEAITALHDALAGKETAEGGE